MTFLQSIILGIIQGVTEFLPISSDGHLNLFQYFFKLSPSLTFDVFLHAATFLSVLFFFKKETKYFFSNLKFIFVASIPAFIVGFFFKDQIETLFLNPKLLPFFFLISGTFVFLTKFISKQEKKLTYLSAFIIGCFQALAILPAISRSGLTIFAALFFGLSPINAFNFSFSMFIPVSLGAIFLKAPDILNQSLVNPNNILTFILTFLIGFFSLSFLKKIVSSQKFWYFGLYVIFLSLILFFII